MALSFIFKGDRDMCTPCHKCTDRKIMCHDYKVYKSCMNNASEARREFMYARSISVESTLRQFSKKI